MTHPNFNIGYAGRRTDPRQQRLDEMHRHFDARQRDREELERRTQEQLDDINRIVIKKYEGRYDGRSDANTIEGEFSTVEELPAITHESDKS